MSLPVTIDGAEIPLDAPRSQGMTDQMAQAVSEAAETYREVVMHLHADIADYDVTLTAANCPEGTVGVAFGDGDAEVTERVEMGATPEFTHTYPADGVYTATLRHSNGDRAFLELQIPTPPEEVVP